MIEVTFNGIKLSQYLRIAEVVRPIGNEQTATVIDNLTLGAVARNVRRSVKEHVIKFDIQASNAIDMEHLKHTLAGVFSVSEPVKITYSDEPDKYYMGLPLGEISTNKITRWFQRSEIKIVIFDGVAHSSAYKTINNPQVIGNKVVFSVQNNGNAPAFPIIKIKHNAENGYIGLVNQTGAFEIGNKEESDAERVKQSEHLFDYRDDKITTGLRSATPNVAVLNDTEQNLRGTVGSVNWQGRQHLYLQNSGGTTGNNAGSLTWDIPRDSSGATGSLDDYIWWRQIFWAGAANQYGFIKLTVSDERGQFLYGVETFKRSNGLGCEYNFMASDGKGSYKMVKRWTFSGTHLDNQNPFNEHRGWSDLKRNDDKVTVHWWGSYNTFTIPEIKGRKSAKIHVALGSIGDKPLVTRMYLDGIMYRKDFVETTKDIPNRFPIGSNVTINFEDDTVFIDGNNSFGDVVDGSDILMLPPGNSDFEVYFSSWARVKPDITLEFEERW